MASNTECKLVVAVVICSTGVTTTYFHYYAFIYNKRLQNISSVLLLCLTIARAFHL